MTYRISDFNDIVMVVRYSFIIIGIVILYDYRYRLPNRYRPYYMHTSNVFYCIILFYCPCALQLHSLIPVVDVLWPAAQFLAEELRAVEPHG